MSFARPGFIRPVGFLARLGRSPAILVSAGLFLFFLAFLSGHLYSVDGLQYYRMAENIVFERSLFFNPPLMWGNPIVNTPTPIGFSLVQIPAVLLSGWARPLQPASDTAGYNWGLLFGDPMYTLSSWVNPLLVALTGAVTFRTAGRLGAPQRKAMLIAIATVLGSPLFFYARADYAQPLSTLMLLVIVAVVIDAVQRRHVWPGLMTGAVTMAVLTRQADGLVIAVLAFVVLCLPLGDWRPWRDARRPGAEVALGVAAAMAVTLVLNAIRYGGPLNFGYSPDFGGSLRLGGIAELFSPGRGLLWYFPLVMLAPIGALFLWRRGLRHETVAMVLPVLAYLPIYAKYASLGGWDWGPRYLVPLIPLLALMAGAVTWPQRGRAPTLLFGALGIVGGLVNVANLAVDPLAGFWQVYGDDLFGTDGFWRQFNLHAFAPIGSWHWYDPAAGPDIMWWRLAGSTHGASLVVFLLLLGLGGLALVRGWKLAGPAGIPAVVEGEQARSCPATRPGASAEAFGERPADDRDRAT